MPESETVTVFLSTLIASAAILIFVAVVLFFLSMTTRLVRRSWRRLKRHAY